MQYSSKLIKQTKSIFKNKTGRKISDEEARQSLENITEFFKVLNEWSEAENIQNQKNK